MKFDQALKTDRPEKLASLRMQLKMNGVRSIIRSKFDHPLGYSTLWIQTVDKHRAQDTIWGQERAEVPYDEIDELMRPLIRDLNAAGFSTRFCCQGVRDRKRSNHSLFAYVMFNFILTPELAKKAVDLGLGISEDADVIFSMDPEKWSRSSHEHFVANRSFEERIRKVFPLKKVDDDA